MVACELGCFLVLLLDGGALPGLCEFWAPLPLILLVVLSSTSGSFLRYKCSVVLTQICSRNYIQTFEFILCFALYFLVICSMISSCSGLPRHSSLSPRLRESLGFVWVLLSFTVIWKLSYISKFGNHKARLICFWSVRSHCLSFPFMSS